MRQPVMNRRSNSPANQGWVALALVTRDEQQDPFPGTGGAIEREINFCPGPIKAVPVKVKDAVRLDPAGTQPPIP